MTEQVWVEKKGAREGEGARGVAERKNGKKMKKSATLKLVFEH